MSGPASSIALMRIRFTASIYEWTARRNWFFVDVPPEPSADIADQPRMPRGFDSVRVTATVGATTWNTSIFPGGDTYALRNGRQDACETGVDACKAGVSTPARQGFRSPYGVLSRHPTSP